jgi:hypothetical protein
MGQERNTGRRSDIRAQRARMIPCVPSQDLTIAVLSAVVSAFGMGRGWPDANRGSDPSLHRD